jgi:hypothetical protein
MVAELSDCAEAVATLHAKFQNDWNLPDQKSNKQAKVKKAAKAALKTAKGSAQRQK